MDPDEENYWNVGANKSFNFDDDAGFGVDFPVRSDKLIFDDAASDTSYEIHSSNGYPMRLLLSELDLKTVLEEQSRNEPVLPKSISIEDEVRFLRREHQEKLHAPSVETTVTKMLMGKPCSLEMFKSLRDKEELLDEALRTRNGDAVLRVVLFLERSLKKQLFHQLLQLRPLALSYYVNYLRTRNQVTECVDLLVMLGKNQEAALIQFEALVGSDSSIETKRAKLVRLYADFFSQPGISPFYSNFVVTFTNLLDFQIAEKNSGHADSADLPGSTALQTLRYIISRHPTTDDAPNFVRHYSILQSQYEWVALNTLGQAQAWRDVEALFEKKSWHSLKQKSFQMSIPIEKAILHLSSLQAPIPVLNHFLSQVSDFDRKLLLARKVGATRAQVDALVALKNRSDLELLRDHLPAGTEERFYAENALKNFGVSKWKADGIKLMK